MTSKNLLVYLVAVFALVAVLSVAGVSAASSTNFGSITSVQVNGVYANSGSVNLGQVEGQTVPVLIQFTANEDAQDVRVKAWISGGSVNSAVTDQFDVIDGVTYSKALMVQIPSDLETETNQSRTLTIIVEDEQGRTAELDIPLTVQRKAYNLQILDVNYDATVAAGSVVPFDIVLKNDGSHFLDDSFVQVSIPALNINQHAYFGDLSPVDQGGDVVSKQDAAERVISLKIPENTPAGIYAVNVQAANGDASDSVTEKIAVQGSASETQIVSPITAKAVDVGETATYSMTFVNTGSQVEVYQLVPSSTSGLSVSVSDPVVVIPAGTSKTVQVSASGNESGTYDFSVQVLSDSNVVKQESFIAKVGTGNATDNGGTDVTILLTVILAIIFVVLLVVLIVLLTRKPTQRAEEFGESYY